MKKYKVIISSIQEIEANDPIEAIDTAVGNLGDNDVAASYWHDENKCWEPL